MHSFWNRINSKYDLDFGEKKLSPILKCSIGITLDYIAEVKRSSVKKPFCLCFPEKFESSIWISLAILRNSFLEDYIFQSSNRIEQLGLKRFDRIEIFDCTAKYISHNDKAINLSFSDVETFSTSVKINTHINRAQNTRINRLELFRKNKKKFRENRNAISKILEPKESVLINSGLLNSKVLLVTGRGNMVKTKNRLSNSYIHNESLAEIFKLGENLLITPDLELYKNAFNKKSKDQIEFFKALFLESYTREFAKMENLALAGKYTALKKLLELDKCSTKEFHDLFEDFIENIDETEFPSVYAVFEKYPGPTEDLPDNLRAIVLNDISLFEIYPETISSFLENGIPVIIVCDRLITLESDANFYSKFFEVYPEIIRINWSRKKLQALVKFDTEPHYLDDLLWNKCKRFAIQKIFIEQFNPHPLDSSIPQLQKMLFTLEGFEKLKVAYWKWLYPAYYAVKNDFNPSEYIVTSFIDNFIAAVSNIIGFAPAEITQLINSATKAITQHISNNKICSEPDHVIFGQQIGWLDGKEVLVPTGIECNETISSDTNKVVFPGYPFNEPLNSILINAISTFYVPEVRILAWPQEANSTYRYIHRRLKGSYYTDYGIHDHEMSTQLLLHNEEQIEREIADIVEFNTPIVRGEDYQLDSFLITLTKSRLGIYKALQSEPGTFAVKCNVIHFEQHDFMFLPHKSKVLTELETREGGLKIKRCPFNELRLGSKLFTHKLSRNKRRKILRQSLTSESILDDLHIWKVELESVYNNSEKDLSKVEEILFDVKAKQNLRGNPNRYNISRWLFDDELLSPDSENLVIILTASGRLNIEESVRRIRAAYRIVTSLNIQIASQLKKQLAAALDSMGNYEADKFTVTVNTVDIEIECRKISALQKDAFEVDYSNTRKILS